MGVVLRELRPADSDFLFRWINDRELVNLSAPFRPVSADAHRAWFAAVVADPSCRIFGIDVESRLIGYCQLLAIDSHNRNAELRIRIGERDMMQRGYGSLAVRQLFAIGFGELGLHRIGLHVLATNARAIRTYLRCGFSQEGVQQEAVLIEGKWTDIVFMGILARDYGTDKPAGG